MRKQFFYFLTLQFVTDNRSWRPGYGTVESEVYLDYFQRKCGRREPNFSLNTRGRDKHVK